MRTSKLLLTKLGGSMISLSALICGAAAESRAGEATLHATFLSLSPNTPFVKNVYIYKPGNITADVKWEDATVKLSLQLKRPNGTVAAQTAGAAGVLTLSYTATQQEVSAAISANAIKWKVEVTRSPQGAAVSGKLRVAYPWDAIQITKSKQFKLGPLANVAPDQYSHSQFFTVLAPGTIQIKASWAPKMLVSAFLVQNTVGAVVQKNTEGPFEVTHHVSEQNLNVPVWNCTFQNLSQQALLGVISIYFVPDR